MNIGLIVYSQSGNTFAVAQKLQEKLQAKGHSANIEKITTTADDTPRATEFDFINAPETTAYDALVFAAPVQAFSLVPVMSGYLNQLTSLEQKKVACLVTKQLPFHWTGGKRAIKQMKELCLAKDANVVGTEIVIWSKKDRDQYIDQCTDNICALF